MQNIGHIIYTLSTWVMPLLLTMILHEVAHGYVALKLGDNTAQREGRLTLNPFDHIDPVGTLIMPLVLLALNSPFLFGWAKPVPVNYNNLNNPKRDMGLVAIAGPLTNFLLAIAFVLFAKIVLPFLPYESFLHIWLTENLQNGILLSVVIGIFNLFPVLPLDGGRVLASLLPMDLSIKYQETERYGFLIIMMLLFVLPMLGIDIIRWFIQTLLPYIMNVIAWFL